MKKNVFLVLLILTLNSYAQSDLDKVMKSGEILVNGLSFFKNNKTDNIKAVESVCVKNKLSDKIFFSLIGKDEEGNILKKELVVQKDGKECVFELPKGIYTYEILLANKEVFKKGEYKFNDDITIIVKQE